MCTDSSCTAANGRARERHLGHINMQVCTDGACAQQQRVCYYLEVIMLPVLVDTFDLILFMWCCFLSW